MKKKFIILFIVSIAIVAILFFVWGIPGFIQAIENLQYIAEIEAPQNIREQIISGSIKYFIYFILFVFLLILLIVLLFWIIKADFSQIIQKNQQLKQQRNEKRKKKKIEKLNEKLNKLK